MNEGIFSQMRKQEEFTLKSPGTYSNKLTVELLQGYIEKIFDKPQPKKRMVIYTIVKYSHILTAKHMKGKYLSLFSKRSNFKLLVQGSTFKIYHGTKLLKVFKDTVNIWNSGSGKMKDTPLKIKEVNDYILTLESLYKEEQRIIEDKAFDEKMINLMNQ